MHSISSCAFNSLGTDLKHEYRESIDKLKVKHHFCKFHVKQRINKRFKNYFDKNKLDEKSIDGLINLKQLIFQLLDEKHLMNLKIYETN